MYTKDVFTEGWTSSKCLDGKRLFESIVIKPKDTLKSVCFTYEGYTIKDSCDGLDNTPHNDEFVHYDNAYYGRCTMLTPSKERIKQGIKDIRLCLYKKAKVFIHTPGMFLTYPEKAMKYLGRQVRLELPAEVKIGERYNWNVKHEVHHHICCMSSYSPRKQLPSYIYFCFFCTIFQVFCLRIRL